MCYHEARRRCRAAKLPLLGSGAFADVYGGTNRAIKIGKEDDAWMDYIAIIKHRHPTNPYAPRVHSIRWYGNEDQRFFVAKMEKLDCTVRDYGNANVMNMHYQCDHFLMANGYATKVDLIPPALFSLLTDIKKFLINARGHGADLHRANAMMRGDQYVVTDPVC